eukprot:TRINITY_DN4649_c0_g1_i2.p1 TRINITY_DN4649_c0_g1~~TRINITY_DN4649_c0_g1_i2.p1  ORF type:complete len:561 (-),score=73.57 TRINITY_DN4649_c0_g1_i2:43-1563(-)
MSHPTDPADPSPSLPAPQPQQPQPRPLRRYRKRVATAKVACIPCAKAKTKCGLERPCQRCVAKDMEHQCVDREHSETTRKRGAKLRIPACDECKTSKAGCDEQECCKRCQRLGIPCVRRPRKRGSSNGDLLTWPATVEAPQGSSDDSDNTKFGADDSKQQMRFAVAFTNDGDELDEEVEDESLHDRVKIEQIPPLQFPLNSQQEFFRLARSISSSLVTQNPVRFYSVDFMFKRYMSSLESLSPFQIADFLMQSSISKFTSLLGVLLVYLPRGACLQLAEKMLSLGIEVSATLYSSASRQRIMGPAPSLPAPLVQSAQELMKAATVVSADFVFSQPSQPGIHVIPYSMFPKFLQNRQMGFFCADYGYDDDSSIHFEISLCPFAEALFGYTSEELGKLCACPPTVAHSLNNMHLVPPLLNLFHEEDWPLFCTCVFQNFMRGPAISYIRVVTKWGNIIPCYAMMYNQFDEQGRPLNFVTGIVPLRSGEIPVLAHQEFAQFLQSLVEAGF